MPESLVVVLLHAHQQPIVFRATKKSLIECARKLVARRGSEDPQPTEFESAWRIIARGRRAAYCFQELGTACLHAQFNPVLTHSERARVLSMLHSLEDSQTPLQVPDIGWSGALEPPRLT